MSLTTENESNRSIGPVDLTGLVVNSVIGAGIFGLPTEAAKCLRGGAPWAYLLGCVAMAPIAAVYAFIGARVDKNGGQYTYVQERLGRVFGRSTALYVLLVRLTSAAVITDMFVKYLGELFPVALASPWRAVVVLSVVTLLAMGNIRGVFLGVRLSSAFTVLKLATLGTFVAAGFFLLKQRFPTTVPATATPGDWTRAVSLLVFAFGGFDAVLCPAGEIKSPRTSLPLALGFGLMTAGGVYFLVQLVATWAVPDLEHYPRPLAAAANAFAGPSGATAMSIAAVLSTLGWLSAAFVAVPQFIRSMAERGDFFLAAARIHPTFGTPYAAIGIWALLVCVVGIDTDFLWFVKLSVGARLLMYSIASVSLLLDPNRASLVGRLAGAATVALCCKLFRPDLPQMLILGAIFAFSAFWTTTRPALRGAEP